MTVPIVAPGTPEANARRRRRLLISGGVVSVLLILGLGLWRIGAAGAGDELTCANSEQVVQQARAEIAAVKADPTLSANEKLEKYKPLWEKRDNARAKTNSDECKQEDASPTTTAPPSGGDPDSCDGVTFSPYAVAGTQRFGPAPVDLANPGSAQDVANAFTNQLKTNRWLSATWSQGSYLVKGGIGTDEVQAKAQSFVKDRAAWRATNAKLRAILGRSTFGLRRSAEPYKTQEAVVTGTNQCVAPAAKDVGLEARGERLLLDIHRAAVDGGGTITVVVDCDGQIHIVEQAPAPTPVPERHTTPTPTSPPVTSPPVTSPPVTQPPPTTPPTVPPTVPPTAPPTTMPPKVCGGPGQPSCTGTGSR